MLKPSKAERETRRGDRSWRFDTRPEFAPISGMTREVDQHLKLRRRWSFTNLEG